MQAEKCFHINGDPIKIGETESFDVATASYDGNAAVTQLYTEWIELSPSYPNGCFELLWTGNAAATVTAEASMSGPAKEMEEIVIDGPDGTAYTGNLDAVDPRKENLGVELINLIGMCVARVRLNIARASGSGTYRARYRSAK